MKRSILSSEQIHLIAKALAVPRRYEILKQIGGESGTLASSRLSARGSSPTSTKSAVDAVTRVLSKELGPKKIRVNSINPGVVETEGARTAGVIGSDCRQNQTFNTRY